MNLYIIVNSNTIYYEKENDSSGGSIDCFCCVFCFCD